MDVKGPLNVACGHCFAEPTQPCKPPIAPGLDFHLERTEAADLAAAAEAVLAGEQTYKPSEADFDNAVMATGLI